MKIGVSTVAYREERLITRCVDQFKGHADRHLVLVSDNPWHGAKEPMDKTPELAEEAGAEVVVGNWDSEHEQRNTGQQVLSDMDWILVVDADEFYSLKSIENLIKVLETTDCPLFACGNLVTFWKSEEWRIDPIERGNIVAVKPYLNFMDKRGVAAVHQYLPADVTMLHYSYVRTDAEMRRKLSTFEHFHEIVPNWYEDVWLKWTPEMQNLHPVWPENWKRAVKYEGDPV